MFFLESQQVVAPILCETLLVVLETTVNRSKSLFSTCMRLHSSFGDVVGKAKQLNACAFYVF